MCGESLMERASRVLGSLRLKAVETAGVRVYHLAPGAWKAAVGAKLAKHARPVWLENGKLVVEVEDAVWQSQLYSLRGQMLGRLEKVVGAGHIRSLEFRVVPPRRAPQRAESADSAFTLASPPAPADEADMIEDPILRRLYRSARRKATA